MPNSFSWGWNIIAYSIAVLAMFVLADGKSERARAGEPDEGFDCGRVVSGRGLAATSADLQILMREPRSVDQALAWRVRHLAITGPRGLRNTRRAIVFANEAQQA